MESLRPRDVLLPATHPRRRSVPRQRRGHRLHVTPMTPRTVRKSIDPDCLLDGELHPSIRMRLERVRELPVKGVVNLRGVELDGGDVYAVWNFAPGRTFEAVSKAAQPDEITRILREAELTLAAMHAAGIVHGAVHERNIIINDAGDVKLTHVSPLLFHDEQVDRDALADLRSRFGTNAL